MKKLLIFMWVVVVCGGAHAQTETTKWYIDGELYATTSCESGGDITMPTEPERFGSVFQGWAPAVYDMSTLDTSINGTSNSMSGMTWRAIFSYGTVYGEALCSPTPEWYTNGVLDTETGSGQYCYCRVTEFIPTDSTIIYGPATSPWVFLRDTNTDQGCATYCSRDCGYYFRTDSTRRDKLFGVQ